jgi:hypothetical protein
MKSNCLSLSRCRITAQGLLLGFALLTWGPASAQNLVKNPDFEQELGPDNWTIVYTGVSNTVPAVIKYPPSQCGPNDFAVKGRTRMAHKDLNPGNGFDGEDGTGTNYWDKHGLDFRAGHDWLMHAYARQVITNLTPGASYTASAWMVLSEDWGAKVQVWMEVLGGAVGNISRSTPFVTAVNPAWARYSVSNSASATGQIEIRLHYNKYGATQVEKWREMDAFYDKVCLMRAGQPEYNPPSTIISFVRPNPGITWTWQTVMNNSYRIQASTNLADPSAWVMLEREANVDTNFAAIGTSFTFNTNVSALFYYSSLDTSHPKNPLYFDPNGPLFFRISSQSYQP